MSALPAGWISISMSDLARSGLMIDGDWIESKDQDPNGEVRLIQLADIGDGVFLDKSSRFVTSVRAHELGCTFLQPGDVLIARMPDPLGRACIFPGIGRPAITAVDVCIWRSRANGANAEWFMHFTNSPAVRAQIAQLAGGTTRQRISGGNLKLLQLPTPPPSEQLRIVAKVKSLFARSRSAREELNRIPQLVERYKITILATALRGNATADWRLAHPHDGTESGTIEAAVESRRREGSSSAVELPKRLALPRTWRAVPIDSIGEVILGRQRSPENHNGPNMRPYVRAANITWGGWDLSDVKTMNFDDRDFDRFMLHHGDVLINEGSGSADEVGKPAIWYDQISGCCFQNTLIAVRPKATSSEYLYFVLLHAALSKAFVDETRGVNIHHIGRAGLAQFVIPLPPIEEQQEIVSKIKVAFGTIDQLFKEATRATQLLARLDQATLGKAFKGKLVPQNPSDAPFQLEDPLVDNAEGIILDRNRKTKAKKQSVMAKITIDTAKEVIRQMSTDRFTFEDLQMRFPADYESLREILFQLLGETPPSITQSFDSESKSMCFTRSDA